MKICKNGYKNKMVLALGMFDSVHRGHTFLIKEAKSLAIKNNMDLGVFTFINNPYKYYGKNLKMVYTFDERARIFNNIGVDVVVAKTMNESYASTSPDDFIENLVNQYNAKILVCGSDYTYGYRGQGNIKTLKEFADKHNIDVKIVDFVKVFNKKISSSIIREKIENGEIEKANNLLGRAYSINGNVVKCFGRGRNYGVPTANILLSDEKLQLKQGVYATTVEVDGKFYVSLTNIGIKPTFSDYSITVESFLEKFEGNLYNKNINVRFYKKIRDIIKFDSEKELYAQIMKDVEYSKNIKRII